MQVLVDEDHFKLVAVGGTELILTMLPHITKKVNGNIVAINLKGLGTTGKNAAMKPWLVTATITKMSYIFYEGEALSMSYVRQHLNLFDERICREAVLAIQKLLSKQ